MVYFRIDYAPRSAPSQTGSTRVVRWLYRAVQHPWHGAPIPGGHLL